MASSALLALLAAACGNADTTCIMGANGELTCDDTTSPEATPPTDDVSLGERVRGLSSDLGIGSSGPEVRAAHDYLMRFGYFPNDELAKGYPRWRPMVDQAPARPDVFDQHFAEAVSAYQDMYHLPQTGIVDAATRTAMQTPRCGYPDGGSDDPDLVEKYAFRDNIFHNFQWPAGSVLTWRLISFPAGFSDIAGLRQLIANALPKWLQNTNDLTAPETQLNGFADSVVRITWNTIDGQSGPVLAHSWGRLDGGAQPHCQQFSAGDDCVGNIEFDIDENWSMQSSTPSGAIDIETILLHEFGHVLGLLHSSDSSSVMRIPYPGPQRSLGADDIVPIIGAFDAFEQVNTTTRVRDIAVANDGSVDGKVWAITNNQMGPSYQIAEMTGPTTFTLDSEAALRVAVAPDGHPWVVDAFGTAYKKTGLHATSNSTDWVAQTAMADSSGNPISTSMCATDIAVGSTGQGLVWAIGCDSVPGGHSIYRYNNSSNRWQKETGGGGAVRIAVDSSGVPWVVNSDGRIFWRGNFNSPAGPSTTLSGTWQVTSATGLANDVGISAKGLPWIIGKDAATGGFGIWMYDGQNAGTSSNQPAPARDVWLRVTNGATAISVGPNGRPWVAASDGTIWRMKP